MRFKRSLIVAAALSLLSVTAPQAQQQSGVRQSGTVTPGHVTSWTTTGVIQDGGTPENPQVTGGLGVASGNQKSICTQNSKSGATSQLCLGATASGGVLTYDTLSGAPLPFQFIINGTTYTFPFPSQPINVPFLTAASYGVVANGVTSDDVALSNAVNACSALGATLWLPPGKILLTGAATINLQNCGIIGSGNPAGRGGLPGRFGTTILLTSNSVKPFLAGDNWSMSGVNFFWPNQTTGSIVYPALLNADASSCNWRFFNNVVANAYDFFTDTPGSCEADWNIHDNIIYVMHYGISSAGQGDQIYINNNLWTPGAWFAFDPVNAPTAYTVARNNNWAYHVKNSVGFGWNVTAKGNSFFAWRGGFLLDSGGRVGISDVDFNIDGMNTILDASSGGVWSESNGLRAIGGCTTFNTGVPSAPCFNLGAGSTFELHDSNLTATGSFIEGTGGQITMRNVTVASLGTQNDGTDYYILHISGVGNIIVQNGLFQGNTLSNKAHVHGITTDITRPSLTVQNSTFNFFQEDLDIQTANKTVVTGNSSNATNGTQSVIVAGGGFVDYRSNNFDKPTVASLSSCGGATVSNGGFSGSFTVGTSGATTACSLTLPFATLGSFCQFTPDSNHTLWALVSGNPPTWVVHSDSDFQGRVVFYNCSAAQ